MSGTEIVELKVNGLSIKTRPFTSLTVKAMGELSRLDSKNEFYELAKATHILRSCLVYPDDWEVFENLSMPEFSEIIAEWTEMQSGESLY